MSSTCEMSCSRVGEGARHATGSLPAAPVTSRACGPRSADCSDISQEVASPHAALTAQRRFDVGRGMAPLAWPNAGDAAVPLADPSMLRCALAQGDAARGSALAHHRLQRGASVAPRRACRCRTLHSARQATATAAWAESGVSHAAPSEGGAPPCRSVRIHPSGLGRGSHRLSRLLPVDRSRRPSSSPPCIRRCPSSLPSPSSVRPLQ